MAEEMVSVGCRLPNGYRLEVGFSVSQKGDGGAPFAMYTKHDDYQVHVLRGLNQHSIIRDESGKPFAVKPSQMNREPVVNQVPKAFWDRWVKEHSDKNGKPTAWVLTSGNVFALPKDTSSAKAAIMDAKAKSPNLFEPINPSDVMKIEDHTITRRLDDE